MEFDDANKPLQDHEYPEPDVDDDDADVDTVVCQFCGESIYEEAVACPSCGNYVNSSTSPWTGRPLWWLIIGLLGIAAVIYALSLAM